MLAHLLVMAIALAVRLSSVASVRLDGDWLLRDGDSYYHLRRVEQTIERGGRVPMFDPWLSYPEGQRIQWHGGYDLMLSALVTAICGTEPQRSCLTTTCVVSTPLLGVIATLLVLLMSRRIAGRWTGLAAASLFALYPYSAGSAAIGYVDHHVMEPLLVAAWFLALVRGRPVLAGLVAGAAFAVFPTALLPVVVSALALAGERLFTHRRGAPVDRRGLIFSVVTTISLIPVVWTGAFADAWEPSATSRFHLAVMLAVTLILVLVEVSVRLAPRHATMITSLVLVAAGAITIAVDWSQLQALTRFFEARGLWTGVLQQVPLGKGPVAMILLVLLVTAACVSSYLLAARRAQAGMRLVALAALPLTLLGLVQIRFLMPASPLLAAVIAHVVLAVMFALRQGLAGQRRRTRILGWAVSLGLAGIALVPLDEYAQGARYRSSKSPFVGGVRILRRLGQSPAHDDSRSVLSDWNWGHHILWLARMPAVSSPFILSGHDRANVLARRALLAEDPQQLYRFMEQRSSRYLLVTQLFSPVLAARSIDAPVPRNPAGSQLLGTPVRGWSRLRLVDAENKARLYELMP